MPKLLFVATVLVSLCACTVEQEIALGSDGTGTGRVTITVDSVVSSYVDSLVKAFGGSDEPVALFDVDAIGAGLASMEGVEVISILSDRPDRVEISFVITDLTALLGSTASFCEEDDSRRLDVEIDRESFVGITAPFIPYDSPAAVFVPTVESDFLDRAEYRELLEYAFGSYLEARGLDELIASSRVRIRFVTDGPVVDVVGGFVDPDSVEAALYDIGVIDLVTLEQPLPLSLTWRNHAP